MVSTQHSLAPTKSGLAHPASSAHIWKNTKKVTEDGAFLGGRKGTWSLGKKEGRSTSDFQLFWKEELQVSLPKKKKATLSLETCEQCWHPAQMWMQCVIFEGQAYIIKLYFLPRCDLGLLLEPFSWKPNKRITDSKRGQTQTQPSGLEILVFTLISQGLISMKTSL